MVLFPQYWYCVLLVLYCISQKYGWKHALCSALVFKLQTGCISYRVVMPPFQYHGHFMHSVTRPHSTFKSCAMCMHSDVWLQLFQNHGQRLYILYCFRCNSRTTDRGYTFRTVFAVISGPWTEFMCCGRDNIRTMDRVHTLYYTSSINGRCKQEMRHITKPSGCCSHIYISFCPLWVLCKMQKKMCLRLFEFAFFFLVVLYWSCPPLQRLGSLLKQVLNDWLMNTDCFNNMLFIIYEYYIRMHACFASRVLVDTGG